MASAKPRHLNNAPITEAILDLRVNLSKDFRPDTFKDMKGRMSDRYPKMEEARYFTAQVQITQGKAPTSEATVGDVQGYFFKSADGLDIAQFRVDGFSYNRLRPYTRWEQFFPEAMRCWELYQSVAQPPFVTRVSVRYINHLKLPIKHGDDLEDYLTALPPMPPGAPGGFSGLLTRVATYDDETGVCSNVTQALEGGVGMAEPAIILDLEAYRGGEEAGPPDRGALEPTFEVLRKVKNDIFFGSITEETARLFE